MITLSKRRHSSTLLKSPPSYVHPLPAPWLLSYTAHTLTKCNTQIPNRSVNECRIQWLENDHPGVNKEKWKAEHLAKLYKLASATEVRDWEAIRHQIGVRVVSLLPLPYKGLM